VKSAKSAILAVVVSTFLAPAAAAQEDPEAVVRGAYGLLSIDPSRPTDRERFDEYFWEHAVVGFGTSLEDVVIMPSGQFYDDLGDLVRAGDYGGVGHEFVVSEVECRSVVDGVTKCFVGVRLEVPEEEAEDFLGAQTVILKRHDGRWLVDSEFWLVAPEAGISLGPDVTVALQMLPTAGSGFRPTPERAWDRVFPIFGDRLVKKGVSFPLPVGLAVLGTWKRQEIELDNLEVAFSGGEPLSGDLLKWGRSVASSWTAQAKLDLWLLPFLDVYAVVGRVGGETEMPFSFLGSDLLELVDAGDLCEGLRPSPTCFKTYSTTVYPPIAGWNYAFGLNPALGYKKFIVTIPTTFTWTDLDAGRWVKSLYVSPRIGLSVPADRAGALTVYIGAAYLTSNNFINGSITFDTDLPVPPDGRIEVEYWVDTKNKDPWNYLVGFNWSLSKKWSVHAEADAGGSRQGATASLTWRF
jgi:hypothetical protein